MLIIFCVPKCSGINWHLLYKDDMLQKRWIHVFRRDENWRLSALSVVCRAHFVAEENVKVKYILFLSLCNIIHRIFKVN